MPPPRSRRLLPGGRRPLTVAGVDSTPVVLGITPNSDLVGGGVAVTISGENFETSSAGDPPTVLFGTAPATSVVVANATTITAVAPAHAFGVVSISVTNWRGQTGTLDFSFTYATPVVLDITPNHGVLAGGTTVQIKGANFSTGIAITFGGNAASSVTFIDNQTYSAVTPAHSVGPVEVVVGGVAWDKPFYYTLLTRGEDIRRNPSIHITGSLGNAPNTCSFDVDGRSSPPQAGEVIEITDSFDDDRLLFSGVVLTVEATFEAKPENLVWHVTAGDYVFWLNRKRPFGTYVRVSITDIVKDLCARYAPWVDATTYVQTGLCQTYITFDGSEDFATVLSRLAKLLGGGHWKLDYQKKLHFFHVIPPDIATPFEPDGVVENKVGVDPGIGPAMSVSLAATPWLANIYVLYWSTFIYSNGLESAFSPITTPVFLDGSHTPVLDNIPIGANVGALTVVARKIYSTLYANGGVTSAGAIVISDNVTTTASGRWVIFDDVQRAIPARPLVAPPAFGVGEGPRVSPSQSTNREALAAFGWKAANAIYTQGVLSGAVAKSYAFRETKVFADGTESQPGPLSNTINVEPGMAVDFVFPEEGSNSVNGVPLVFRKVYVAYAPVGSPPQFVSRGGLIIPGDNEERVTLPPSMFVLRPESDVIGPPVLGSVNTIDPCVDGPSLEEGLPQPEDLPNADLCKDPPITHTIDVSQVRNRVYVRGAGTVTTVADAPIGSTNVDVADASVLPPNGGIVLIGGVPIAITSAVTILGISNITFERSISAPIPIGTPVQAVVVVNDLAAQNALGRIELDVNGNNTDGIHEGYIADPSLITIDQMLARGYAELELFARPVVTVRYASRSPLTIPGRKIVIDIDKPPIKGEFLIQTVEIDQVHDISERVTPRYIATASSVKFELEDLLLLIAAQLQNEQVSSSTGLVETAIAQGIQVVGEQFITFDISDVQLEAIVATTSPIVVCVNGVAGSIIKVTKIAYEKNVPVAVPVATWTSSGAFEVRYVDTDFGPGNQLVGTTFTLDLNNARSATDGSTAMGSGYTTYSTRDPRGKSVGIFWAGSIPTPNSAKAIRATYTALRITLFYFLHQSISTEALN